MDINVPWLSGAENIVIRCPGCDTVLATIPLNIDHQHGGENGQPVSGP